MLYNVHVMKFSQPTLKKFSYMHYVMAKIRICVSGLDDRGNIL